MVELVILHPPRFGSLFFHGLLFAFLCLYALLFHSQEGGGGFFAYCVFALLGRRRIITARFLLEKRGHTGISLFQVQFYASTKFHWVTLLDDTENHFIREILKSIAIIFLFQLGKDFSTPEKHCNFFLFARLFIR